MLEEGLEDTFGKEQLKWVLFLAVHFIIPE